MIPFAATMAEAADRDIEPMPRKANRTKKSAKRPARVGGVPIRPAPRSGESIAKSVAVPAATSDPRESHVALSLLKYFYWIELGIRSYLRSRSNIEFSRAEGLVIASIMLGYNRPSDISRQLGVSRQAIHVTIQQMHKKGMVQLKPDPHDRRIRQVVLTDLARQMNDDGIVAMNLLWKELGKRLGQTNLARAARVLRADWGPPVLFDADEVGPEWWHG
jgi:DNA-binding MarR family transcriptional regulator